MVPKALWKGYLKLALIACPVALYSATSEPERRRFTWFHRATGNKIEQPKLDSVTGEKVEYKDIAKGLDVGGGRYVEVTQDELDAVAPKSAEVIDIATFVALSDLRDVRHYGEHYFLSPQGDAAQAAFALIRTAIARAKVMALAQLARGSHEDVIALAACGNGMVVSPLRYPAELRDPEPCFAKIVDAKPDPELLELTRTLVAARTADGFELDAFSDRYAAAIEKLVRKKIAGEMIAPRKAGPPPRMTSLAEAVRRSAEQGAPHRKRA